MKSKHSQLQGKVDVILAETDDVPDLAIIENGVCQYSIVRPEESSAFLISSMNYLHGAMVDKFLCNIKRTTDWVIGDSSASIVESEELKYITKDMEVTVNLVDGKWVPEFEEEDKNVLFGNLNKVAEIL